MRPRIPVCTFVALFAGLLITAAHADDIPEIAPLEAAYQQSVSEKVDAPYQTSVKKLNQSYQATLDGALKASTAEGSLDRVVAVNAEAKRFAESGMVPVTDEPGTTAEIARWRAAWRAEMIRLGQVQATTSQQLLDAYVARLRALEKDLTRAQKIDEAKAVRAKTEALAASALLTAPPPAPTAPPVAATPPVAVASPAAAAAATPRPAIAFTLGRPAERMDLYASANNHAEIYINNKQVLKDVVRDNFSKARVGIHEGDVIAIKGPDRFSDNFVWISAVATTGEFLFESSLKWQCYLPRSPKSWWDVKSPRKTAPVTFFEVANNEYVKMVRASAAKTPFYRGAFPIHNTLQDGDQSHSPSYCYYIVTKEDLMPKKAE